MKKEELTAIGLTEEQADKIFALNGKDVEAVKTKYADYDTLKTQLAEAGKTIEGFKAMDTDIEGIKKAAEDWKAKATKAEQDAAAKIAEMEFNALLDGAVGAAKGKNAKAVRALLDVETLKASKNQEADIKAALEAMQKESGYLFDTAAAPHVVSNTPGAQGTMTKEAFGKLGYRDRVALKAESPSLYESLTKE